MLGKKPSITTTPFIFRRFNATCFALCISTYHHADKVLKKSYHVEHTPFYTVYVCDLDRNLLYHENTYDKPKPINSKIYQVYIYNRNYFNALFIVILLYVLDGFMIIIILTALIVYLQ
jgi:hypothetical protein